MQTAGVYSEEDAALCAEVLGSVSQLGAVRYPQVRGEVARPGKFLDAQGAAVLDAQWTVHLHVPIQAALGSKRTIARSAVRGWRFLGRP